ncbi:MAG: hypothetical protein HYV07_00310 [Deltaproteobacteria bacterium]|nr:hypothetical protein [Deltaproteobacteria bacterium]
MSEANLPAGRIYSDRAPPIAVSEANLRDEPAAPSVSSDEPATPSVSSDELPSSERALDSSTKGGLAWSNIEPVRASAPPLTSPLIDSSRSDTLPTWDVAQADSSAGRSDFEPPFSSDASAFIDEIDAQAPDEDFEDFDEVLSSLEESGSEGTDDDSQPALEPDRIGAPWLDGARTERPIASNPFATREPLAVQEPVPLAAREPLISDEPTPTPAAHEAAEAAPLGAPAHPSSSEDLAMLLERLEAEELTIEDAVEPPSESPVHPQHDPLKTSGELRASVQSAVASFLSSDELPVVAFTATSAGDRTGSLPSARGPETGEAPIRGPAQPAPIPEAAPAIILEIPPEPLEIPADATNRISLAEVGSLKIMLGCAMQRPTGTLRVMTEEGAFKLTYVEGSVTEVATSIETLSFAQVLEASSVDHVAVLMADRESRGRATETARILIGRRLLDLTSATMLLRRWSATVLGHMVSARAGVCHFAHFTGLSTQFPLPLGRFEAPVEALRAGLNRDALEQRLTPYADAGFTLAEHASARAEDFEHDIAASLISMDGARSLRSLLAERQHDASAYRTMLHAVYLGLEAELLTPVKPQRSRQAQVLQEVRQELARLSSAMPADVLGVRPGATFEELKARVEQLRAAYKPLPEGETRELAEAKAQLFSLFQNAIMVLARDASSAPPRSASAARTPSSASRVPVHPTPAPQIPAASHKPAPPMPAAAQKPAPPMPAAAQKPAQVPPPREAPREVQAPPASFAPPDDVATGELTRPRAGSVREIALRPGQAVAVRKRAAVAEVAVPVSPAKHEEPAKLAPPDPVEHRDYFEEAKSLAKKGKYEQATSALEKAVAADPTQRPLYRCFQEYYKVLDNKGEQFGAAEKAIQHIESLMAHVPSTQAAPHILLGRLYKIVKDKDASAAAFAKALDIDPNDADARAEANLAKRRDRSTSEVMHEKSSLGRAFSAITEKLAGDTGKKPKEPKGKAKKKKK